MPSPLHRRIGLVLSLTLVGGFAGFLYGETAPPTYTARAYVATTADAIPYARAYARIATSGPIRTRAAALLGTDTSGLDHVRASASAGVPLIELTATARTAPRAVYLANAVARALTAYGGEHQSSLPAGLTILAEATTPTRPSSPSPPCELLIGASAGLLAGAVAALLTLRRRPPRPSFDDPAEIEGHLRIWRAQYGARSVTAYRGAAALTEPADWTPPAPPADPSPSDPSPPAERP
jgi:hypothetical protein